MMGPWRNENSMAGLGTASPGDYSKVWDCLSVWHQGAPSHTAWGMPGADVSAESWTGVDCNVVDEFVQFCHQGMQPCERRGVP